MLEPRGIQRFCSGTEGKPNVGKKMKALFRCDMCTLCVNFWQNVTHWNCAHSMTLHFSPFFAVVFSPLLFSLMYSAQQGQSKKKKKNRGRLAEERQGNFSLTVLLCVTAVLIANLLRDGESKRGMNEDRKRVGARKRHKERDNEKLSG